MTDAVSVVAPVYNESAVLLELARRAAAAAAQVSSHPEVVLSDDASTDGTTALADQLPPTVRLVRSPVNQGQLGATRFGLREAHGDVVVVIDGDLQDPPEVLVELVETLRARPELDAVVGVKTARDDPMWFRLGNAGYRALLSLPGARSVPSGAGSYCAMRATLAQRVAATTMPSANLCPLLVALDARLGTVPYAKAARYDGRSRVGPLGLAREAIASMALTGSLRAVLGWASIPFLLTAVWQPVALVVAIGMVLAGQALHHRARRHLAPPSEAR